MILDGGRSALRGTDLEEALDCIRCGACLYSCPMWRSVGGPGLRLALLRARSGRS